MNAFPINFWWHLILRTFRAEIISSSSRLFVAFWDSCGPSCLQRATEIRLGHCSSPGRRWWHHHPAEGGPGKPFGPARTLKTKSNRFLLKATPPGSNIYTVRGYDQDGDRLIFGIQKTRDSDVIKLTNLNNDQNEAVVTLEQELDAETRWDQFQ